MNEIKIKSIRKMDKSEYLNEYKYSINVEDNHNYFLNNGVLSKNCVVLIDEIQNIDMHTFKTLITRIGYSSKMVFLGDVEQIDRKTKNESCLTKVCELFKDQEFAGSVTFEACDSVRNPIIPKLLEILSDK
jgi:predicted ribonuclease YlaK